MGRGAAVVAALLLLAGLPAAGRTAEDSYHIVLPRRAAGAGERIQLRVSPPPPPGVRVNWWIRSGAAGIGFLGGVYRAPLVIPAGTPPVRVSVTFWPGPRIDASTEIELLPGSVAGAEECLGPGQSFSTVTADLATGDVQLDVLPQLLQGAEPDYPARDRARGIEDTLAIGALVCRSGRVLDAVLRPRFRDRRDPEPVPSDPQMAQAALDAVRRYVFSPGMSAGQPVAVWVENVVIFHR